MNLRTGTLGSGILVLAFLCSPAIAQTAKMKAREAGRIEQLILKLEDEGREAL